MITEHSKRQNSVIAVIVLANTAVTLQTANQNTVPEISSNQSYVGTRPQLSNVKVVFLAREQFCSLVNLIRLEVIHTLNNPITAENLILSVI